MEYVVKMDGMKVRKWIVNSDKDLELMKRWAERHCRGKKVGYVKLTDCGRLPKACGKLYPDLSMSKLVYKPFVGVV